MFFKIINLFYVFYINYNMKAQIIKHIKNQKIINKTYAF